MIKNLDRIECELILKQNYIGHLAYVYQNKPFVIPITYFFNANKIICYSGEGHKINAMRKHAPVALEVSDITSVNHWQSIAVHGSYEEYEGSEAKALLHEFSLGIKDIIMTKERRDLDFISEFSAKIAKNDIPIVFVINIEEITGKMRRK
ncbi:pyridoxamine 5'-phosphate oxidase family protein [uncultured Psychroserpens sp.]|uniref:pyridoxamine 5'-phosphate oxidase family protein n=1 Tax=uncultured Psychroserpens sp. TaxID=255436 RepID=UPI0026200890|nr:pyridoxamine 5'-phosphate oxidase family protein [uncultured Psychroserpens sp.]